MAAVILCFLLVAGAAAQADKLRTIDETSVLPVSAPLGGGTELMLSALYKHVLSAWEGRGQGIWESHQTSI